MLRFRVLGASFSNLGASFSSFGCFVFELWVLRFRNLGASFSNFGCFVLRSSFSSASFSKLPFSRLLLCKAPKNVSSVAVLTSDLEQPRSQGSLLPAPMGAGKREPLGTRLDLELPRSNRKREYAVRTVRLIVSYCSNGKR